MKIVKEKAIKLDLNPSLRLKFFRTETATFIVKFMIYKKFLSMAAIASYGGVSREYIRRIFIYREFNFKEFKSKN